MFMSNLFLHILGVDIDIWVCSNEPSKQPSELLMGSYIWTSKCFFWFPSFLTVVLCAELSDVHKHTNVLQHFEPYEGCLFISFKNYLKHINEKSICFDKHDDFFFEVQKNISLHLSSSLHATDDFKYSCLSMK